MNECHYNLLFCNTNVSYLQREQRNIFFDHHNKFHPVDPENWVASPTSLTHSFEQLIRNIRINFKLKPSNLISTARLIEIKCHEQDYKIPRIEAFERITSWGHLVDVFLSLEDSSNDYRFELLLALITQSAKRFGSILTSI